MKATRLACSPASGTCASTALQYAIEADPGRLTASFPVSEAREEVERSRDFLRGRGIPNGVSADWPRILVRRVCEHGRNPWAVAG